MADFLAARATTRLGGGASPKAEDEEQMRVLSALLGCLIVAESAGVEPLPSQAAAMPPISVAAVA